MEKKVLTQEELQEVKNLQVENNNLISQFGELEVVIQNLSLRKEETEARSNVLVQVLSPGHLQSLET